jgi:transglutaminase-like putative cysteine protease
MQPEVTDLSRYLEASAVVDWRSPEIMNLAHELTDDLESDVGKARRLYEWVRDEIPHSKDAGHEVVTCRASEVLRHRTGICYAKSHLLAAMLRSVDIPAGFCYQVLCKDPPYHGLEVHGLNGIFLSSVGRWIRLDARGNTGAIQAQFNLDEEQLAFPVNPIRGEYIAETIYAEPLPVVVDCLRRFTTRSEMWPHLPQSLDQSCPD